MSATTWLRFRRGEVSHAIIGGTDTHWLLPCGITYSRRIGEPDTRAKKCKKCSRAVRPVSAQQQGARKMQGHMPE